MRDIDAIGGMYNIVLKSERKTANHQVPVATFIEMLEEHDIPEELCVVGLEDVLADDQKRQELVDVMRRESDNLNGIDPLPKIQFAVAGELQSVGNSYELLHEGEFYPLDLVFSSTIKRRSDGWLVSPYRI